MFGDVTDMEDLAIVVYISVNAFIAADKRVIDGAAQNELSGIRQPVGQISKLRLGLSR